MSPSSSVYPEVIDNLIDDVLDAHFLIKSLFVWRTQKIFFVPPFTHFFFVELMRVRFGRMSCQSLGEW